MASLNDLHFPSSQANALTATSVLRVDPNERYCLLQPGSPCISHFPAVAMEHQFSAQALPDSYYGPYPQQARRNGGWNPIAAAPDLDWPSPAPPPRSRVPLAPASLPIGTDTDTPFNVGLGVGSADHIPGHYPVVSRDSFQQDSRPTTPPHANNSPRSAIPPQEYPLVSPYGAAYCYPQQYGTSPPAGGTRGRRLAWLTESRGWKMAHGGWPMYATFCLGFAFAAGHHVFYSHLDEKPADDQIRMMRFGGLLAYSVKASLVTSVFFAYRQQIWVTVIGNVLQLKTVDSLFAAADEPLALLNWEFIRKAHVAVCLAVLAW